MPEIPTPTHHTLKTMKSMRTKISRATLVLFAVTIPAGFSQVISFTPPYNIYSQGATNNDPPDYQLIDNNPNWTVAPFNNPHISTVAYNGHDYLRIARFSGNSGSADIFYTGSSPSPVFADFSGSVIFSDGGFNQLSGDGFGVILRSAGSGNNFSTVNKFFVAVRATGTNRSLGIYFGGGDNFIQSWPTVLDLEALQSNLSITAEYLLTFSAIGPTISASLFLLDSQGNIDGPALASVFTNQATQRSEGYVGFRGGRYSANDRGIMFRDFQITVIPEPATAALLLIGGALLFARSRRRA